MGHRDRTRGYALSFAWAFLWERDAGRFHALLASPSPVDTADPARGGGGVRRRPGSGHHRVCPGV